MQNQARPPGQSELSRLFWPLILVLFRVLFLPNQMPPETSAPTEVAYSEIKALIRDGMVSEATLQPAAIVAVFITRR